MMQKEMKKKTGLSTDWKKKAEQLKFERGLSWAEVAQVMQEDFPEMSEHAVYEKVRRAMRRSSLYHPVVNSSGKNTRFFHKASGDVNLYIIADVHNGAHGFCKEAFINYIERIRKDDKAAVIVLGDLIDNATQGSKGCVYSQRVSPQKQIESIIEMLYPVKDKIIFICSGNHEERTFRQTGSDAMYTICLGLGILEKYNYVHGYITIKAGAQTYKIYATHNIGKSENKLKTMARVYADCDIIAGGHIHTRKALPVVSVMHNGSTKTTYAVIANAWLRDESYAISAAYEPSNITQLDINLSSTSHDVKISL